MDGQQLSSTMDGATASVQDEVVELNRKFYTWISSSWEMCPHFCWNGAAQEYINQINRILDNGSRGGSTSHAQTTGHKSSPNPSALHSPESASRPPFPSAPTTADAAVPPAAPAASPPTQAHMPIPSTSPILPSASPPAIRSRKRGAQGEHPDDPNAQATARSGFSFGASAAAPKPKPSAPPFKSSKPSTSDTVAPSVPTPPLFSSFGTSSKAASSGASFGGQASGPSASKPLGAPATSPTFGALGASTAPSFGTYSTSSFAMSSAATAQPASSPSFSFKPNTSAAADPKSPSLPLFSSISASGTSAASSAAKAGGFSAGFSFSQPAGAKSTTPKFSFGQAHGGATTTAASSAAFSFASPAAGGFGSGFGNGGTPAFNFGAASAAAGTNGSAAAADGDEEPQEKTEKVEIKGDDKTDITFSGKSAFRAKSESGWGDPIVGLLTLRRDKATGRCWLQVNSETKGSIFVYASIPSSAKFRTPEGKSCVNMIVNVFRYTPGQEPKKMGDDGKGGKKQLDEKEENTSSPKSVMIKTKSNELQSLVDALKDFGCQTIQ